MADLNVNTLVSRVMERYDRNKDGKIQVPQNADGMPRVASKANAGKAFMEDETQVSDKGLGLGNNLIQKAVNMVALFKDSDTDGDGFATRAEIKNLIKSFDSNANNIVGSEKVKGSPRTEIELLTENYPEEFKTNTVPIDLEKQQCYGDVKTFSNSVYGESLEKPASSAPPRALTKNELIQEEIKKLDEEIAAKERSLQVVGRKAAGNIFDNPKERVEGVKREIEALKVQKRLIITE